MVDVEGAFVDLIVVVVLAPSVGRDDGLNAAVVRFGVVVRVGADVVGAGNVVAS